MKVLACALLSFVAVEASASRPYQKGAVAAAHPLASAAGQDMLAKGGNAVDAAVAAAFVMAVVGPYHSGLGGGGFALFYNAEEKTTVALDFREVAPRAAHKDMYVVSGKLEPSLATDGGMAVAVPGAVKGYLELLSTHGKLKPRVVLAPAIRAAEKGFWVTPRYQQMARARLSCLSENADARRIFLKTNDDGTAAVPEVGTILKQPELAQTLRALVTKGAAAFYEGPIAGALVESVQAQGGILSLEDLALYKVSARTPLEGTYRRHRILTMPPPSAGGLTVLQVLGALETLGTRGERGLASREIFVVHRYIEALRRAFVDRARHVGDPAFVEVPVDRLISLSGLSDLVATINPMMATPTPSLLPAAKPKQAEEAEKPAKSEEQKNTTHISVIDQKGHAVALTTTVNYWFGSCVVAKGTGILLNNQMDDFALQPMVPNTYGLLSGEANAIAPGKIPVSSMSPTLVFSREKPEQVMLAVGSPGGSTIPSTVIQVISHTLDGPMDVAQAVSFGRVHHQAFPDVVRVEPFALEPATRKALEAMGHTLEVAMPWGDAEAVYRDPQTGLFQASSDPRNEGQAAGLE